MRKSARDSLRTRPALRRHGRRDRRNIDHQVLRSCPSQSCCTAPIFQFLPIAAANRELSAIKLPPELMQQFEPAMTRSPYFSQL